MNEQNDFFGIRANSAIDAFCLAAAGSKIDEMKSLLGSGVDINGIASYSHSNALCTAASHGQTKSLKFLLDNGADINLPAGNDMTPLMMACANGKVKGSKIALLLIESGADINLVRRSDEMTALKFSMGACKPEVIQTLIENGAEVDGPAGTDQTALMLAARNNNVEALKILVKSGADVKLKCKLPWAKNRMALGLAKMENRKNAAEYLATLEEET